MPVNRLKQLLRSWLMLIGTIVVLIAVLRPHDRRLLQRATPIVHLGAEGSYCWLTDQKLLFVSQDLCLDQIHNRSPCYVAMLDLSTGAVIHYPAVEKLINSSHGYYVYFAPDKKHLLWESEQGREYADLNGRLLPAPRMQDESDPLMSGISLFPPAFSIVVGDRVLAFKDDEFDGISLDEYRRGSPGKPIRHSWLASPRNRPIQLSYDHALSEQGKRVCFSIVEPHAASPALDWLSSVIPYVGPFYGNRLQYALLISETDSVVLHDLGATPSLKGRDDGLLPEVPAISDLAFTPDEKRVSFVYQDTLYIVPIDD